MDKQDILKAILSKDSAKITEAKAAIKALLDARASQFRSDSSKFVAQSLFEGGFSSGNERKERLKDVESAFHDLHDAHKRGAKTYAKNHEERIKTQHGEKALSHYAEYSKARDSYLHHDHEQNKAYVKHRDPKDHTKGWEHHPEYKHHSAELHKAIKHMGHVLDKAKKESAAHRAANPNIPEPK